MLKFKLDGNRGTMDSNGFISWLSINCHIDSLADTSKLKIAVLMESAIQGHTVKVESIPCGVSGKNQYDYTEMRMRQAENHGQCDENMMLGIYQS